MHALKGMQNHACVLTPPCHMLTDIKEQAGACLPTTLLHWHSFSIAKTCSDDDDNNNNNIKKQNSNKKKKKIATQAHASVLPTIDRKLQDCQTLVPKPQAYNFRYQQNPHRRLCTCTSRSWTTYENTKIVEYTTGIASVNNRPCSSRIAPLLMV